MQIRAEAGQSRLGLPLSATLLAVPPAAHARGMFMVSEVDAAAIRAAYERGGDLLAAVELRSEAPGSPIHTRQKRSVLSP